MALPSGEHAVGRMADCWLTLDDELTSRYHARFVVGPDRAEVEDLGSRNGTFVNGERIDKRRALKDGDRVRIGRELIAIVRSDASDEESPGISRTLAPGEDTGFPSLVPQLVTKSLRSGNFKDAERYATALIRQMDEMKLEREHPAVAACTQCLIELAERTRSGVWIDRLFRLLSSQGWVLSRPDVDAVRAALDRIPRVPGTGLRDYERYLTRVTRDGQKIPTGLCSTVAEIADAYAQD